jgi:hypothetical protein
MITSEQKLFSATLKKQQRAQRTQHSLFNEYDAPQHHPPMPPIKATGGIKQNRRGLPTATPLSPSGFSGVVRFGRAREWQHRLMGCMFWVKFGRRGV